MAFDEKQMNDKIYDVVDDLNHAYWNDIEPNAMGILFLKTYADYFYEIIMNKDYEE